MSVNPFETVKDIIDTSPKISDEVKTTTCYMCACRCGIKVHLKDNKVRYIEGNRDHPVNKGVLCAKGSAGIMQHYSPARLTKPLKRVGERGAGEFKEIEWDEALELATEWLSKIRDTDPRKLAFFYRPRSEPGINRVLGQSVWHPKSCRPWRLLLRQYGSRWTVYDRWLLLGVR
jgi:anaerobic selenocysteine-containing dehydrogenase